MSAMKNTAFSQDIDSSAIAIAHFASHVEVLASGGGCLYEVAHCNAFAGLWS
jgi:hypothetical protein